ncbi:UNVERIFIED_CONTAM: hypothetical protein GTU68_047551 [Idotea baltica]|nr:hypothetical protein [Idotea baltica]
MFNMNQRNFLVDFLALSFGVGAWVSINGIWVELPILVEELPEGWSLPSYMSIVTQIANIGPIAYSLLRIFRPSIKPVPFIYVILLIGCASSVLLAIFWDETSMIGGTERSTALLILVFFLAFVDCTSSVLYIPYMAVWRDVYLPSYLIGEGLSGFLPAVVALGQGVGGNSDCQNVSFVDNITGDVSWGLEAVPLDPNFSVDVFFYIIFAMMVASMLAFILLEKFPSIQGERSRDNISNTTLSLSNLDSSNSILSDNLIKPSMKRGTFVFLLIVQAWSSMLSNGFLPSIQSYSCGPYGNVAYHLAATLSALANPLAALCTMILPRAFPKLVGLLSLVGTGFASYIITTAVMSPSPPLMDYKSGSILIVLMWVAFIGVITYVRVEIANLMREDGASPLFWSGVVTQTGSAIGAIVAFFLVNKTSIFETYYPCA